MFGWKRLGAIWPSEQAYQVLEILKQHRIRWRMPADDMFFYSPFYLPRPDRRWAIKVRREDMARAMALLAREGLARGPAADPYAASPGTFMKNPSHSGTNPARPPFNYYGKSKTGGCYP